MTADAATIRADIARLNAAAHAKYTKAQCLMCAGFILDEQARQLWYRLQAITVPDETAGATQIVGEVVTGDFANTVVEAAR